MKLRFVFFLVLVACASVCFSQTAEELVNRNLQARGGLEKLQAIRTVRISGTAIGSDGTPVKLMVENMRPDFVREETTIAGMTGIAAYDGKVGWQIQPFGGRKDPQLMGEDDLRDLLIDSDLEGPLINYKAKGNSVEFMGHDEVDGDDALRLKVTMKDGDIIYYYLDPDTYLEIRKEIQEFIRGAVKESVIDLGSYKAVAGVMFPFSMTFGPKDDPSSATSVTVDRIEVNVPLSAADFAVPASLKKQTP